jgi:hypothetical protein
MARRALKPLTPLLVGLAALVLGFLAIGTSFAGTGPGTGGPSTVAPVDGPIPATRSVSAPPNQPAPLAPVTAGTPGTINYGPKDCVSCMGPPVG